MSNKLFAAVALLGTSALVQAVSNTAPGSAIVINKCSYPVYIHDVPAAGEGGTELDPPALASGGVWSQHWTGLTSASGSHDGWSIKLGKTSDMSNLLQYEYTYQPTVNANIVWLDLSSVDGASNPWANDGWTLTTSKNCSQTLKQDTSYQNPTDDAAMQPECPADADITVILCQSPGSGSSIVASVSSAISSAESVVSSVISQVVPTSIIPLATTTSAAAPVVTTSATPSSTSTHTSSTPTTFTTKAQHTYGFGNHEFVANVASSSEASSAPSVSPTTFATSVSSVAEFYGQTITEVETAWVTSFVTADGPEPTEARKRHEHHAAHHHA